MKQRAKRVTVVLLAVAFAVLLGVGLLLAFWSNRSRFADHTAELSEEDFEFNYISSFAYTADTEETSGDNGVYGWGYDTGNEDKEHATYAYITKIDSSKLADLKEKGVTKIVINIPETHNNVPVKFIQQDAFNNCELTIIDIKMPLSVYWQIKGRERFTLDNNSAFARADGMTATFTAFKSASGSGITTLILPSNVWIDEDSDDKMGDNEPTYRYTEYLFEGNSGAAYTNLVVMPDVVNIFNGKATTDSGTPRLQGGLLSKSKNLQSVFFCTGRSEVLHLYPLTFENCTSLREISLSAGVYLEDGARVFQGSSSLEKFFVAEEKKAAAPLFYTVGADGALYTNDYAYDYFSQSNTEKYYKWWKNGNPSSTAYTNELSPIKAYDSQRTMEESRLEQDKEKANCEYKGDTSATTAPTQMYYAKGSSGKYDGGIGIPEGSYVFDVNGTDKNGSEDNENDFEKGSSSGQYESTANFQSAVLKTTEKGNSDGTKASISLDGGGSITVTEVGGNTQDQAAITIGGVEYKSRMQLKNNSTRYLEINVPFDFDLCVYFAGAYTATEAQGKTKPQLALFDSKNITIDSKSKKYTATNSALATLEDVTDVSITESDQHLLKIEGSKLKSGTKYYIAQPSDDKITSGYAQMFFLVITPVKEQSVSSIVVEQALTTEEPTEDTEWEKVQNDSLLLSGIADSYYDIDTYVDRKHSSLSLNATESNKLYFRMKLLSATGDVVTSKNVETHVMKVDDEVMYNKYITLDDYSPSLYHFAVDEEGYFHFYLRLDGGLFGDYRYNALANYVRNGLTAVIRINSGSVTKDLYINFSFPQLRDETKIPDPTETAASSDDVKYISLTEEWANRYQRLVSMPAKARNDLNEYVNSFEFNYRETVEIGPNAFQNTFITVIDIPDRIAKIGASAFRFSDRLQTVYLPEKAEIALNAFGQEADADNINETVFTAGKKNFFLIAPSRISYEAYMNPSAAKEAIPPEEEGGEGTPAVPADVNYNTFPIHVEAEALGFDARVADSGRGKDASYDYTPYLTYEITVNFLWYTRENDSSPYYVSGTETRSFLYGQDAHFVKAAETTEWAKFDGNYDNNAPVYFGYISDGAVQQINTIATDIPWTVAAGGWYYDKNASFPEAYTWKYGSSSVYSVKGGDEEVGIATKLTEFFSGNGTDSDNSDAPHIGVANTLEIENRAKAHYRDVYDATSSVKGVTETGKAAGDLREVPDATETHKTMPFSITLKSVENGTVDKIALNVPDFQRLLGEVTLDNELTNILEKGPKVNDSWLVPQLTVTFDFNGFAPSRIFDGFNSSVMEVAYLSEYTYDTGEDDERGYSIYGNGWASTAPVTDSQSFEACTFESMSYHGIPYDTGTYLIKLSLKDTTQYTWGGAYNGVHVAAGDTSDKYFLLEIDYYRLRDVHYAMYVEYTGDEVTLFENSPYYQASYKVLIDNGRSERDEPANKIQFEDGTSVIGSLGPNGLPCGVGVYEIEITCLDPKSIELHALYPDKYNYNYSHNIEMSGCNLKGPTNTIRLYIIDKDRPFTDGDQYWDDDYADDLGNHDYYVYYDAPMALIADEAQSFTYRGAPITLKEVFGSSDGSMARFDENTVDYTLTRDGVPVTEVREVGTYTIKVTPAEGYVWWRGLEKQRYESGWVHDGWYMDEFWEKLDGSGKYESYDDKYDRYYEDFKRATLTFTFTVDPRPVTVPKDSYVPVEADPPYNFPAPIGGDYEVVGYHLVTDYGADPPKASETTAWQSVIFERGIYDVLLRLTDPKNCVWYPDAGESRGDNFYVTALLYAGFDREKAYPAFIEDLGTTEGEHTDGGWVTLTRTYDGNTYGLDALFAEDPLSPTDKEALYTIYKLSGEPGSVGEFSLLGEEVETIKDAGYYGITVILNDPFLYKETAGSMTAYYLVNIEKAEIKATFGLSNLGSDGGNATYDGSDHLKDLNDAIISFATAYDSLTVGRDYNVVITSPVNTPEMIDAGTYTVKVELLSSDVARNYVLTEGETQYVIDARPLTLGLGTITGHTYLDTPAASWHDQETLTYSNETDGAVVAGDDLQLSYQFKLGGNTFPSLNAFSNAGDYTVEAVCGNPNYKVTLQSAYTYTVAAREIALNDIAGVTYDGTEHKPNVSFTGEKMVLAEDEDYSLTYAEDAASGAQLGGTGLPLTAGSYTVTVTLLSTNYTFADSDSATAKFTIEKATLPTPYLSSLFFSYTGDDVCEDVTDALGNYNADVMEISFYDTNDGTGEPLDKIVDVGTHFVKVTIADPNYKWNGGTETYLQFTVAKRATTSVTITASDVELTYGDAVQYPTVSGVPAGYEVTYLYNYEGKDGTEYAASSVAPTNVGTYEVTVSAVYAGSINDEPFTASATATLTIVARKLTFSLDSTEGTGGLVNAVFKDEKGNSVALAASDYTFAYSFNGTAVEGMTVAGDYTVTVTLSGDAAKNNTLTNATAVYKLTQGLSGGEPIPVDPADTAAKENFDIGIIVVMIIVQAVLLGVGFGLAAKKKREQNPNAKEDKRK